jgi:hypothetical protein
MRGCFQILDRAQELVGIGVAERAQLKKNLVERLTTADDRGIVLGCR